MNSKIKRIIDFSTAFGPSGMEDEVSKLEEDYNKVLSNIENGKAKMNETKLKLKQDEIERTKKRIVEFEELYQKHGSILTLGAILYFIRGREVISFIGGAYEEYLEFQPFYSLNYEMIKYAVDNKYDYYNFYGISSDLSPKDPMYGIYIFKKGFGGEVVELIGEYDYIVSPKTIKIIRMLEYVDISKISKLDVSDTVKKEINAFIDDYYDRYTGLYLKSKNFLKKLVNI